MAVLKPEIRKIWDSISGINADEDFVKMEFEKRNLKREIHRNIYSIMYDALGRCHISDQLSTMSRTAEIAIMKKLIKDDIVSDDTNYLYKKN